MVDKVILNIGFTVEGNTSKISPEKKLNDNMSEYTFTKWYMISNTTLINCKIKWNLLL